MKIKEIMFTENDIAGIVSELADKINSDYKDCQSLTLICVLKGSVIFTADLIAVEKLSLNRLKNLMFQIMMFW